MIYFLTNERELKKFYSFNDDTLVVYDRDSDTGLTELTSYRQIIDQNVLDALYPDFASILYEQPVEVRNYIFTIWNNVPSLHYEPQLDEELVALLDSLIEQGDIFALYFREVYYFQRVIIKFDDEFLKTYKGQFKNADKRIVTGTM